MSPQSSRIIKIFILGPANSGKTSIARFLFTANRSLAMNTKPSTSIERFKTSVLVLRINIFVTPGQRRFKTRNIEYLSRILDPESVILYVVDASEKTRLHDYLEEFIETLDKVEKVFQETFPNGKVEIAFLAHKQDISGAISVKEIFGDNLVRKITETFPHISLHLYDTSIFSPASLLQVITDLVLSKMIPADSIKNLLTHLKDYAAAEAAVIGDGMGFPVFFSGDHNLASWSAALAARIIESLERERKIANELEDATSMRLLNSSKAMKVRLSLTLGENELNTYVYQLGEFSISLTLINARNRTDVLDAYAIRAIETLFSKIYQGQQAYGSLGS